MSISDLKFKYLRLGMLIFLYAIQGNAQSTQSTTIGTLDNGLTYYINPTQGDAYNYLYLVIKVGSIDEEDHELGYAHFLEHMAFAGGENYPKIKFTNLLKRKGFKMGVHYNAITNYDYTVYQIKLPKYADKDLITKTLFFFEDIIHGLTIMPRDIVIQKKVVEQEMKSRKFTDELLDFKLGESLYHFRNPIGDLSHIQKIKQKDIQSFYLINYCPSKSAIILIGNFPENKTKQTIQNVFSRIDSKPLADKKHGLFDHLIPNTFKTVVNTKNPRSYICLAIETHNRPLTIKDKYLYQLWNSIISQRLKERLHNQFTSFNYSNEYFLSDVCYNIISFSTNQFINDNLQQLWNEMYSVSNNLISTAEWQYHLKKYPIKPSVSFDNPEVEAEHLMNVFLGKELLSDAMLNTPTRQEFLQFSKALYQKSNKRVYIELNNSMLSDVIKIPLEPVDLKYNYSYFNNQEKEFTSNKQFFPLLDLESENYVHISFYPKYNITLLNYNNGVRVILKPILNADKIINVSGFAEGGTSHISNNKYYKYESTLPYLEMGGFNHFNSAEVMDILYENEISLNFGISEFYRQINASTTSSFQNLMLSIYLKMLKSNIDASEFNKSIQEQIDNLDNSSSKGHININHILANVRGIYSADRMGPQTISELESLDIHQLHEFYKQCFAFGNDWNFIITGNFKTEDLIITLNKYLGSLPISDTAFPKNKPIELGKYYKHKTNYVNTKRESLTLYEVFESTYEPNLKNYISLLIIEKLLNQRLIQRLRNELGITYSPKINLEIFSSPLHRYQIQFSIELEDNYLNLVQSEIESILSSVKINDIEPSAFPASKAAVKNDLNYILLSEDIYVWNIFLTNILQRNYDLNSIDKLDIMLEKISSQDLQKLLTKLTLKLSYVEKIN